MTREERRERIRQLVDAAPLLPAEDIGQLRGLLPGIRRTATAPVVLQPRTNPAVRPEAA